MERDGSSNCLNLLPLGIPTLIIADDPQLIAAARAAYPHWPAEAPVSKPKIEIVLEAASASSESVSLDIRVEGSRLRLAGSGAEGAADADNGSAWARLSPAVASDGAPFTEVLDTLLLFLLARSGRTPVHASAFLLGDLAVVLAGRSGSGKSTLALAAAERGYPVLSDDTVFVQRAPAFALWGFPRPIHVFLDDAPPGEHPRRIRNGKLKAALPIAAPAVRAERCALALLERGSSVALEPMDASEASGRLMELDPGFDLLREDSHAAIAALAANGAWRLTLGSDAGAAIDLVARHFAAS